MNGRFQMQGGKNWILPKQVNENRFFWDSHWLEIWSNHFCPSMGLNGGSVATDSDLTVQQDGLLPSSPQWQQATAHRLQQLGNSSSNGQMGGNRKQETRVNVKIWMFNCTVIKNQLSSHRHKVEEGQDKTSQEKNIDGIFLITLDRSHHVPMSSKKETTFHYCCRIKSSFELYPMF